MYSIQYSKTIYLQCITYLYISLTVVPSLKEREITIVPYVLKKMYNSNLIQALKKFHPLSSFFLRFPSVYENFGVKHPPAALLHPIQ